MDGCKVEGCTAELTPGRGSAGGFCSRHYKQVRREQRDSSGKALKYVRPGELEDSVQVNFRAPQALVRSLHRAAYRLGVDISEVWRLAGAAFLKRKP